MTEPLVSVTDLVKDYGEFRALHGVSFRVERGEIHGLLGPNGAGKSTTVEILQGLRRPTSGRVSICGLDPQRAPRQVRERVGVQLQSTQLHPRLRVAEAIDWFAQFYRAPRSTAEMIAAVDLVDRRDTRFDQLSGGMKQRLALAIALVGNPDFVVLDEPTSGLDPAARRSLHRLISTLRDEGRGVLLTTHYIEEAERLCDRVSVLADGRILTSGTPADLVSQSGQTNVDLQTAAAVDPESLRQLEGVRNCRANGTRLTLSIDDASTQVREILRVLEAQGCELLHLKVAPPSLEDLILEWTDPETRA